jgi:tRNA-dihydrouridine synthase B
MGNEGLYVPLMLGGFNIPGRLILAPMAGYTDGVMRLMCERYGAALCVTEMVSAKGLLMGGASGALLETPREAGATAAQIFGSDPDTMAQAARRIEAEFAGRIDIIDINMGCPARKVTRMGEGSALLNDLPLASRIMTAVARAVKLPVSVKIRLGYQPGRDVSVEMAQRAADAGVCAMTVHGRTCAQGYAGQADWDPVAAVKRAVGGAVAVIGNGDVKNVRDAQRRMEQSGCDAVMIGRAAIGAPWVFADRPLGCAEKRAVVREHLEREIAARGERLALPFMRKILAAYVHGMPGAARTRARILGASDAATVFAAVDEIFCGMEEGGGK